MAAPRQTLVVASIVAITIGVAGGLFGGTLPPTFTDVPNSQSANAARVLSAATGVDPEWDVTVLLRPSRGVPSVPKARWLHVAAIMAADRDVRQVLTPSNTHALLSRNGGLALVVAQLRPADLETHMAIARNLQHRLAGMRDITIGGRAAFYADGTRLSEAGIVSAERIAIPFALLLAFLVFRGLIAALVPVLGAVVVTASAYGALRLVALTGDMSIFALNVVTALGLGLSIDYSLLVVQRYREEASSRGHGPEAVLATVRSAGPTVAFSAATVGCAGLALTVFPQPFLRSIGIGVALVAAAAWVMAVLVLPAALTVLGPSLDRLSPAWLQRSAARAARPDRDGSWYREARLVLRHPELVAALTTTALVGLGTFMVVDFRPGVTQPDLIPRDQPSRQVADTVQSAFPGVTTPFFAVIRTPRAPGAKIASTIRRYAAVTARPATAGVTVARVAPTLWRVDFATKARPDSDAAQALVRAARRHPLPYPVLVGGDAARLADLTTSLKARAPLAGLILVLTAFALIFAATGSAVLPLKALVLNGLTLLATGGVLVLVFQHHALEALLGYTDVGSLEASTVLLVAALAFALATDYGLFLLTRIREFHEQGLDDEDAIALGLERTGRIITAAAAVLFVALFALVTARHDLVKYVGVGTGAAIVIDATIVRAMLVPALMKLLGNWNWWAPPPLRRWRPPRETPVGGPPPIAAEPATAPTGTAPSPQAHPRTPS